MPPTPTTYRDTDAAVSYLTTHTVAVIGYGDQGRAHARNLANSGIDVLVGLQSESPARTLARRDGMSVGTPGEVAAEATVVSMLVPPDRQSEVFDEVREGLTAGDTVIFGDGRGVHDGPIVPPSFVDVAMLAPARPGPAVREAFTAGSGVPATMAVYRAHSDEATERTLAYAKAIGCTLAGVVETTFDAAVVADRFAEQAVAAGCSPRHLEVATEVLTEAGVDEQVAKHACCRRFTEAVDRWSAAWVSEETEPAVPAPPSDVDATYRRTLEATLAGMRSVSPARKHSASDGRPVPQTDGGEDAPQRDRTPGRSKHVPPRGARGVANVWSRGGESLGYDEAGEDSSSAENRQSASDD